ncbi:MAG: acyl carrier protein [Gammaproteobacteria bacterium]|nr:acyl carrier protein [Gammaproteobacteria bacterium]
MSDYSEILDRLNELLKPYIKADSDIVLTEDSDLMTDLGLNSVKVMDLLLNIEDSFDISIPLSELPDIRTVRDFALLLERMTTQGNA